MLSRLFRLFFLWRIADHIHETDIKVNKLINIKVVLTGKIKFLLSSLFKYTLMSDGKPISGSPITIRSTEKYILSTYNSRYLVVIYEEVMYVKNLWNQRNIYQFQLLHPLLIPLYWHNEASELPSEIEEKQLHTRDLLPIPKGHRYLFRQLQKHFILYWQKQNWLYQRIFSPPA